MKYNPEIYNYKSLVVGNNTKVKSYFKCLLLNAFEVSFCLDDTLMAVKMWVLQCINVVNLPIFASVYFPLLGCTNTGIRLQFSII